MLSSKKIHEKYGEEIWIFIPITWRPWWLTNLQSKFPQKFFNLTLEQPFPVFKDKTADIKEWNDDINSYVLSRLVSAANKFLQPTIKCPWGCSEFQHKAGFLPLDIVLQRILQRYTLKMISNPNDLDTIKCIREDYIRDEGDEDMLFFNLKWKVLPSIAFVKNKGPVMLTCNEHSSGTKLCTIHTCRWKHNLASKRLDQLCQAVLQPRIMKPIKASSYSTSYQMFLQNESFSGIDTCSATSYGNYNFKSILLSESEARSIYNLPTYRQLRQPLCLSLIHASWVSML